MNYLLSGLYLLFTTCGVIFMKLGGDSLKISFSDGFVFKIGFLTFLGFVFYLFSFILWQKLLVTYNLSFIIPVLTSLAQILSVIAAFIIFKEPITVFKIIGIVLIIGGIALLSVKGVN